jgi:hypothetical protein
MGGNQSKNTPLECMVKHFIKRFNGDYGVKLTPNKLRAICEVDRPSEGSLDKTVVNEVYRVIVGKPGHPDQFPYINADRMLSAANPHG